MGKNKKKTQQKNKSVNKQQKVEEVKQNLEIKNVPQKQIKIQQPKIEESVIQNSVSYNQEIKLSEQDNRKSQQQSKKPILQTQSLKQEIDNVVQIEDNHLDELKCRSQSKNKKKKNKKKKKEKSEHALKSQNQSVDDHQSRQKSEKKSQTFSDKVKQEKFNIFQKFIKLKANLNNQKPKQHSKFLDKVADKIVQNATQQQHIQQDKKKPMNRQIKKIKKPGQEIIQTETKQVKQSKKETQCQVLCSFNEEMDQKYQIQTPQKPKIKLLTFSSMKEDDVPILQPSQEQFDLLLENEQLKTKPIITSNAFSKKVKKINFQPQMEQSKQILVDTSHKLLKASDERQIQEQSHQKQKKQITYQQTLQTQPNENQLLEKIQINCINSENQSNSEEKDNQNQRSAIIQNETLIQVPQIRFNLVLSQDSSSPRSKVLKKQELFNEIPQININYVKSQGSPLNSQDQQIPDIKISYAKSETSQQNNQDLQHISFKVPNLKQQMISQSQQISEGRNRSQSVGQLMNARDIQFSVHKKRQSEKENKNLSFSQSLKKKIQQIQLTDGKRLSQQHQISSKVDSSSQLKSESNQENLIQSYNFGEEEDKLSQKQLCHTDKNISNQINKSKQNQISVLQRLGKLFQQEQSKKEQRKKDHEYYFGQDVGEDIDLIKQVTQSQQYQVNEDECTDLTKSKQLMQQSYEVMNLSLSDSNNLHVNMKNENNQHQQQQIRKNKDKIGEESLNFINTNESQAFNLQLSNVQITKNQSIPSTQLAEMALIDNTHEEKHPFKQQEKLDNQRQKQNQIQKQILVVTDEKLPISDSKGCGLKGTIIQENCFFVQFKNTMEHVFLLNKIEPQNAQNQTEDQSINVEELVQFQQKIIKTIQNKKSKVEPSSSLSFGSNGRIWKPITTKSMNQQLAQNSLSQSLKQQDQIVNQASYDKNELRKKNYYFTKYDPKQSLSLAIMDVDVTNIVQSPQKKQEGNFVNNHNQQAELINRRNMNKESFILKNSNQLMTKSFIKKRTFKDIRIEEGQNKKRNFEETKSNFKLQEQQNSFDSDHQHEMQEVYHMMQMQQTLLKNNLTNNKPPIVIQANSQKHTNKLKIDLNINTQIPLPNPTLNQSPDKKRHNLSSRSATKLKEQMTIELDDNIANPLTFRQNNHTNSSTKFNNTGHFYSNSGQIYESQTKNSQQIQPTRLNIDNFKQVNQKQKNKPKTEQSASSHRLFPSNFKFAAQQIQSIEIQKLDQMGSLQMDSFKEFYRQINNKDKNYYDDQQNNYQEKQDTLILQSRQRYDIPPTQTKKNRDNTISLYTDEKLKPQSIQSQPKQIFFKQTQNHQMYNNRLQENANSNFNHGVIPYFGINSLTLGAMNIVNHFNPMKKMHTIDNKQKPIVKISYNKKIQHPLNQQSKNQILKNQEKSKSKSSHKKITVQLKQKHQTSLNKNQNNLNKNQNSQNRQQKSYKINLYENISSQKRQEYENIDQSNKKINEKKDHHQQYYSYNQNNIDNNYKTNFKNQQKLINQDQEKSNRKIQITFSSRVQNHKNQQNEINQAQIQGSKQKIHIKLQDQTKKYTLKQELFKEKLKKTIGIKAVNNQLPSKIQQKTKGKKQKLTLNQANHKTKAQQSTVQNGQKQIFNSLEQPKYVKQLKNSVQKLAYIKSKNILQSAKKRISSNSRSRMSQYSKQKDSSQTDNFNVQSPTNKQVEQHNKYVTQQYCEYSYSAGKSSSSRRSGLSKWNDQISSLKKSREVHGKASPKIFNESRHPAQRIIGITKWNENISEYKKQHQKQRSRSKSSKYQSRISSRYEVKQANKSSQNQHNNSKMNLNGSKNKIGVQIKKHKYQTNNIKMHYL